MDKEKGNTSSGLSATRGNKKPASEHELQQMIAEKAYFRALSRGFQGGDSVEDWLIAEREISKKFSGFSQ
ncbi:MAG: DUF2934 domain-containing protein [Pseudomonadota bacterium]